MCGEDERFMPRSGRTQARGPGESWLVLSFYRTICGRGTSDVLYPIFQDVRPIGRGQIVEVSVERLVRTSFVSPQGNCERPCPSHITSASVYYVKFEEVGLHNGPAPARYVRDVR